MDELQKMLAAIKQAETELRSAGGKSAQELETLKVELGEMRSALEALTVRANRPGELVTLASPELEKRMKAFLAYARTGDQTEVRSLAGLDEDGAVFLPPDYAKEIKSLAAALNELRPFASVGKTGKSSVKTPTLSRPKASYGNVTPTDQELTAGGTTYEVNIAKALVVIPEDNLSDSEYDIAGKLVQLFSEALSELESEKFMLGSGTGEPLGVLNTATKLNAVVSLVAGSMGADDAAAVDLVMKAFYKLKKAYRNRAVLMCNSQTEAFLDTIRDDDGKKLLTRDGGVSWFNGIQIVTVEAMDDIAAGKFPIVIGDLKNYDIYDRENLSVKRLTGGNYDTSSTVGFLLRARHAAGVTISEAFVPVQIKAA